MSSVDKFISHFFLDFGRSNMFKTSWSGNGPLDPAHLEMACKTINIPGITFTEGKYDGKKYAVGYDFDSFEATFYMDAEGKTKDEFDTWSEKVYQKKKGVFGFKNDYVAEVSVDLYTRDFSVYHTVKIINCYPTNISPIEVSWDNEGTVMELSVSFNFDYYE